MKQDWAQKKDSIDHCGLPFWEAAFLLFGQNCAAGDTYGITKTGMKGLQWNVVSFYSFKRSSFIEMSILICCVA